MFTEHLVIVSEVVEKSSERLNPDLSAVIQEKSGKLSQALAEEEAKVKETL